MTARKPPEKPVTPPAPAQSAGQPAGDPGWFPVTNDLFERRMSRLERVIRDIDEHLSAVEKRITGQITQQGATMAADFDQLNTDLQTLATGYASLQAANAILQSAVDSASADKAAAVAQQLADDNAVDQAAVDAADAVAQGVLNPPPAPPA